MCSPLCVDNDHSKFFDSLGATAIYKTFTICIEIVQEGYPEHNSTRGYFWGTIVPLKARGCAGRGNGSDNNAVCPYRIDEADAVFHLQFTVQTRYVMLDGIL